MDGSGCTEIGMVDCTVGGEAGSVMEVGLLLRNVEGEELVEGFSLSIIRGVGGVEVLMGLSEVGIIME